MKSNLLKFNVLVRGENVKVKIKGSFQKLNFYNRRYIKAENKIAAEHLIVQVLINELKAYYCLSNDRYDPPRLFVINIEEMASFEGVKLPGSGFQFYYEPND